MVTRHFTLLRDRKQVVRRVPTASPPETRKHDEAIADGPGVTRNGRHRLARLDPHT
jgi:hypothetical protein